MNTKKILFILKDGWSARFLLRSDILATVKQAGCRVGILTPNADESYFIDEFQDAQTEILALDMEEQFNYLEQRPLNKVTKALRNFTIKDSGNLATLDILYENYRARRWPQGGKAARLLDFTLWWLRHNKPTRELIYQIENALYPGPESMLALMRGFEPDVVVGVTLGHFLAELYAMRQARRAGAKLVTVVQSWDNDAKFGMAGVRPDLVLTWSENLRREFIRCHEFDPDMVKSTGVPHFDLYAKPELLQKRQEFCASMGLDPDPERKFLFFATKAPQNFPYNNDIVDIMDRAMRESQLARPCQLLVRLHPQHYRTGFEPMDMGAMSEFNRRYAEVCKQNPHIVLNMPKILSNKLDMDRGYDDMVELGAILRHSDVVINPFSTLNVEASIFDVPVVNVGFDGYGDPTYIHPSYRPIAHDERHVHNQRMLATGCTRIARSPEQLIEVINNYLENPALDREGRRRLVEQECGEMDGQAGRRAGLEILRLAGVDVR